MQLKAMVDCQIMAINPHQDKGERRRKRRICLQSIFIFYEFFKNSFLQTCFSSNTTQD